MGKVFEANHPLIKHKLSLIRDKKTEMYEFRKFCNDISVFLLYEAFRDFSVIDEKIDTPISTTIGKKILESKITFTVILRAGLGMLDGILEILPKAKVSHIGLYRDESTFKAVEYFSKFPKDISDTKVFLLDPMIATGGSIIDAITMLKDKNVKDITVLSLISSPQGIENIVNKFDDVDIYVASIDKGLNEKGYIIPGLGDAGDRIFGTN